MLLAVKLINIWNDYRAKLITNPIYLIIDPHLYLIVSLGHCCFSPPHQCSTSASACRRNPRGNSKSDAREREREREGTELTGTSKSQLPVQCRWRLGLTSYCQWQLLPEALWGHPSMCCLANLALSPIPAKGGERAREKRERVWVRSG